MPFDVPWAHRRAAALALALASVLAITFAPSAGARPDHRLTSRAAADTQPPSVPSGMAWTTKTATSIGLKWNASSDNVGVAGYRIYRNGVVVGTTTSLSYTVSGLSCATSYTIALE